tara:strand:+ start:587 stop:997 length:411 start_codon:yes stop_codon:yes gene_type:complete
MSFQGDILNGWPEDGEPDMSTLYKVSTDNIGGEEVKSNSQYVLRDNKRLNNLVLSSTKLFANQETNGHSHDGQEEVYIFTKGKGEMIIREKGREECRFPVKKDDVVLIPDGAFHKVINTSHLGLFFICVFDGERYK